MQDNPLGGGFEKYLTRHAATFDIETTGLKAMRDTVTQVGMFTGGKAQGFRVKAYQLLDQVPEDQVPDKLADYTYGRKTVSEKLKSGAHIYSKWSAKHTFFNKAEKKLKLMESLEQMVRSAEGKHLWVHNLNFERKMLAPHLASIHGVEKTGFSSRLPGGNRGYLLKNKGINTAIQKIGKVRNYPNKYLEGWSKIGGLYRSTISSAKVEGALDIQDILKSNIAKSQLTPMSAGEPRRSLMKKTYDVFTGTNVNMVKQIMMGQAEIHGASADAIDEAKVLEHQLGLNKRLSTGNVTNSDKAFLRSWDKEISRLRPLNTRKAMLTNILAMKTGGASSEIYGDIKKMMYRTDGLDNQLDQLRDWFTARTPESSPGKLRDADIKRRHNIFDKYRGMSVSQLEQQLEVVSDKKQRHTVKSSNRAVLKTTGGMSGAANQVRSSVEDDIGTTIRKTLEPGKDHSYGHTDTWKQKFRKYKGKAVEASRNLWKNKRPHLAKVDSFLNKQVGRGRYGVYAMAGLAALETTTNIIGNTYDMLFGDRSSLSSPLTGIRRAVTGWDQIEGINNHHTRDIDNFMSDFGSGRHQEKQAGGFQAYMDSNNAENAANMEIFKKMGAKRTDVAVLNKTFSTDFTGKLHVVELKRDHIMVEDGDTVKIKQGVLSQVFGGKEVSVRLEGIDAPEIGHGDEKFEQPYGYKSKSTLESLLAGSETIKLYFDENQASKGRAIGVLFSEGENLNAKMLAVGAAAALPFGKSEMRIQNTNVLLGAEHVARKHQAGIWKFDAHRMHAEIGERLGNRITYNTLNQQKRSNGPALMAYKKTFENMSTGNLAYSSALVDHFSGQLKREFRSGKERYKHFSGMKKHQGTMMHSMTPNENISDFGSKYDWVKATVNSAKSLNNRYPALKEVFAYGATYGAVNSDGMAEFGFQSSNGMMLAAASYGKFGGGKTAGLMAAVSMGAMIKNWGLEDSPSLNVGVNSAALSYVAPIMFNSHNVKKGGKVLRDMRAITMARFNYGVQDSPIKRDILSGGRWLIDKTRKAIPNGVVDTGKGLFNSMGEVFTKRLSMPKRARFKRAGIFGASMAMGHWLFFGSNSSEGIKEDYSEYQGHHGIRPNNNVSDFGSGFKRKDVLQEFNSFLRTQFKRRTQSTDLGRLEEAAIQSVEKKPIVSKYMSMDFERKIPAALSGEAKYSQRVVRDPTAVTPRKDSKITMNEAIESKNIDVRIQTQKPNNYVANSKKTPESSLSRQGHAGVVNDMLYNNAIGHNRPRNSIPKIYSQRRGKNSGVYS